MFFRSLILAFFGSIIFCQYIYARPNPENGVRREYYPNGKVHVEAVFKKGHLARSRSFYKNGELMSEFRYQRGLLHRKRTFYENGALKSEWSIKTGIMKFYNHEGVLTHEVKVEF